MKLNTARERCYSLYLHNGHLRILIERHRDGYVAYPLLLKGVVIGQGDSYQQALDDVRSAIRFHLETFGKEELEEDSDIIEARVIDEKVL